MYQLSWIISLGYGLQGVTDDVQFFVTETNKLSNPFVVLVRGWFYGGGLAIAVAHRSGLTVLPYHDTSDKPINLVQQKKPNVAHESGCNSVLKSWKLI